jgi:hypothetical protein
MKKLLLAPLLGLWALLALLPTTPALAACGVNFVPQVGVICDIARNPTYSATAVGLVPASSATDIFCISGSTTKTISIRKITIGGTAGTAITTPFLIYQRSALDTGGTAATGLALPVPVPTNPTDPTATAVLTSYTGNPTVAATPILEDAALVDLPVTTAAGAPPSISLTYGTPIDFLNKGLDIPKSTTLQDCVNLNGVSVSSGVLVINMQWQEQ